MTDLIDAREAADLLGTNYEALRKALFRDPDAPKPAKITGRSRLWKRKEIERWDKTRQNARA